MKAGGFLDMCKFTTPWGDQYPCGGRPIPLTQLPIGYNMRGKTVYFTNTEKGSPGGGQQRLNARLTLNAYTLTGPTQPRVYVGGFPDGLFILCDANGVWVNSSFTYPDDRDALITLNTLEGAVGEQWSFDDAYILE